MSERAIGSRRARDMRFLDYAKRCANAAARDREDAQCRAMLLAMLESMRQRLALVGCTYEDLQRAVNECEPRGSYLDPLPDEQTPAERPSVMPKRGWRRLLRGLREAFRW